MMVGTTGYFESAAPNCLTGWCSDRRGRPAAVTIHINGVVADTIHPRRRLLSRFHSSLELRCRFEIPLSATPGDKIEVLDAATGSPLAGGPRTITNPNWRPRIAIANPVREEARYLLEWIAYHRALGVESFLLGDNGGNDRTSELVMALDEAGLAHRRDWLDAKAFQVRFDVDAIECLRGLADVVSITDTDEFLRPLNNRADIVSSVRELFTLPEVSAAALSLVVYGSSGHLKQGDGLVIERFTRRGPDDHIHHRTVKSMVRPERFAGMVNPHVVMLTAGQYINDRGEPVNWSSTPAKTHAASWNCLRVDHFVVKSRHEFAAKAARGRVDLQDGIADRDEAFFHDRDRNEVSDPIPVSFVQQAKEELHAMCDRLDRFSRRWQALRHLHRIDPLHRGGRS
jgi:hypothetical protein